MASPLRFLALLPLAASLSAQESWRIHELPAACRGASVSEAGPAELLDANHLPFPTDMPRLADPSEPRIPQSMLLQLLEDHVDSADTPAAIELSGEQLFVFAEPGGHAAVEEALSALEGIGEQLEIELSVSLSSFGQEPGNWRRSVMSGTRSAFGVRRSASYLGSHDVNVATDSAVAEPEVHQALLGHTVHITASRLPSGRVLIEGTLDLARMDTLGSFDPDTVDLGILHLPEVQVLQVRFAGIDRVRVEVDSGNEEESGLVVTATPGPVSGSGPWRAFDVSAFTRATNDLRPVETGQLGERPGNEPDGRATLDAGALASLVSTGAFDPIQWTSDLLIVDRGGDGEDAIHELCTALEASLVAGTVATGLEESTIRFPVVSGRQARLVTGIERRAATEVSSTLAPSTWMPILDVERHFDGLVIHVMPNSAGANASGVQTARVDEERIEEAVAGLSALQRIERLRRGGSVKLDPSAPGATELFPAGPAGPQVSVRLTRE